MTDSRPDITVRPDGAFVVLTLAWPGGMREFPMSVGDAARLITKLYKAGQEAELVLREQRVAVEAPKPKTWRQEKAML